jgi:hypothetical protein
MDTRDILINFVKQKSNIPKIYVRTLGNIKDHGTRFL